MQTELRRETQGIYELYKKQTHWLSPLKVFSRQRRRCWGSCRDFCKGLTSIHLYDGSTNFSNLATAIGRNAFDWITSGNKNTRSFVWILWNFTEWRLWSSNRSFQQTFSAKDGLCSKWQLRKQKFGSCSNCKYKKDVSWHINKYIDQWLEKNLCKANMLKRTYKANNLGLKT